jgi:hypothetical protein
MEPSALADGTVKFRGTPIEKNWPRVLARSIWTMETTKRYYFKLHTYMGVSHRRSKFKIRRKATHPFNVHTYTSCSYSESCEIKA